MVKRSRRKRSVKHYQKEFEYNQEMSSTPDKRYESPVRNSQNHTQIEILLEQPVEAENIPDYVSKFEEN